MKTSTSRSLLALVLLLFVDLTPTELRAQVPATISYQGRITASGTNFSGPGQFKFALVDAGTNVARQATATATVNTGIIAGILVTEGGAGYTSAPIVTITDVTGTGATAVAVVSGGAVAAVNVVNNGSGYSASPTVTIASPPPSLVFVNHWSNDGTSVAGSEPAAAVSVGVSQGLFTVALGDTNLAHMAALPVSALLHENVGLRIWFGDGLGGFEPLSPDQRLTAAGYALVAASLAGPLPGGGLSGSYSNVVALQNAGNSFTGNGAGLTSLNASRLSNGTVPDARLSASVARTSQVWLLGGNAGTKPDADFLGTTDDQALELKVNGLRALRVEFGGDSIDPDTFPDGAPNVIGGSPANYVAAGVVGAVIAGGGATNYNGNSVGNAISARFGSIGGGISNIIHSQATSARIGGGQQNIIGAAAYVGSIGGGYANEIGGGSPYSTIGGGHRNSIQVEADESTIGGGANNVIGPSSLRSTVGGGSSNSIEDAAEQSTIGGGFENTVSTNATDATIGGGRYNWVGYRADSSTIVGGAANRVGDNSIRGTVGGGQSNDIGADSANCTIAGGFDNGIGTNSPNSVIGGGHWNEIKANSSGSTIGGGDYNDVGANASWATIPGGESNYATNYAFAAGRRARADHTGAFVWADSTDADFASTATNQVSFRCNGGVRFTTGSVGANQSVQWVPGAASWVFVSDRATKEGLAPVDSRKVLEKVASLPISEWNYRGYPQRHIGPMAQDFHSRFPLNDSDTTLNDADLHGVALAAIQGLNQKLEAGMQNAEARTRSLDRTLAQKETEIAELKEAVAELQQVVRRYAKSE